MILECDSCQAVVDAELVSTYDDFDENESAAGRYSFLKCPKCHRPFIALQVDFGGGWESPNRLYPATSSGLDLSIPQPIRAAFEEARSCFKAKAFTAAAIMCRKTLEGICQESGSSARTLAAALTEMKDRGIIESRLYQWAEMLRVSGNQAAHGVNTAISPQDAKDILDFTSALLEYVFTFQRRFEIFAQRRVSPHGA